MSSVRTLTKLAAVVAFVAALATPALAGFRLEKTLKLDPGGRFVLDSDVGSVTVTGAKEPGARIVITSARDDLASLMDFSFEDGPSVARVTGRKKSWSGWPRSLSVHYEVQVPAQTNAQIRTGGGSVKLHGLRGECDLRTSGGSIEASGLAGNLMAYTSGGHIALHEIRGTARVETSGGSIEVGALEGSLRGHTSGGPVRAEKVTGDVDVHTSGGSIHVRGAGGRVIAKTSGGSVEVDFDRGNTKGGELETSGGSIRVALDPSANLNLDASASGGGVNTDLPIKVVGRTAHDSLHGTLGSGGETMRLHTSGGSIHIVTQ